MRIITFGPKYISKISVENPFQEPNCTAAAVGAIVVVAVCAEGDEEDGGDVGAEALQHEVAERGTDGRRVPEASCVRCGRVVVAEGEVAGEAVGHRGGACERRAAGHGVQVALRRGVRRHAEEVPARLREKAGLVE